MKPILFSLIALSAVSVQAGKPNILVIMCDDLGYADVGFNGSPDIKTPELDKLAAAGTVCTSGYVTHPFCGPSRMGLMSGRYPHAFGGQFNLPPRQLGIEEYNKLGVPESETLVGTVLQDAGYYTGIVGKWHLGEEDKFHPNTRGFDDFYGFLGGGHNYFPEQYEPAYARQVKAGRKNIYDYLLPLQHNGMKVKGKEYMTDELTGEAVRFLNQAAGKGKPFFLFVSYNAPHSPMEAKEEDLEQYKHIANQKRRIVAGMIAAVDRGVGRVANTLKENGQFENTLIIFLSDNGGKTVLGSSNAPLRGYKGDVWEGGFRVPMFWHWPGRIPAQKYDHPVSSLDLYPTFAALANAHIPNGKILDGRNILEDLVNGTDARKGGYIFQMRHRNNYTDISARRSDWKVVRFGANPWRLFNITDDPGETQDLSAQHPERVREMVKATEAWSRTHTEPQWFHALPARDAWINNNMPKFDRDFTPDIGAPELPPVVHITDEPAEGGEALPPPSGVKLNKGDSDLHHFLTVRKAQDEKADRKFDREGAEKLFHTMDDDKNGVVTGQEKKAYWDKGKAPPTTGQSTTPPPNVKLKKGDQTLEMFISKEKAKWERNGWPWNQEKVESNFAEMDANNDGIASGKERQAWYKAKK